MMQSDKQQLKSASLLDFEAANYFRLDPCQLQMFADRSKWAHESARSFDSDQPRANHTHRRNSHRYAESEMNLMPGALRLSAGEKSAAMRSNNREASRPERIYHAHSPGARSRNELSARDAPSQHSPMRLARKTTRRGNHINTGESSSLRSAHNKQKEYRLGSELYAGRGASQCPERERQRTLPTRAVSDCYQSTTAIRSNIRLDGRVPMAPALDQFAGSSTASTSSLPSISSSPSVSPSLVCPHLSLDDLLGGRGGGGDQSRVPTRKQQRSPHTIGLCAICRTNAPPNAHSPLSPMYRPSRRSAGYTDEPTKRKPADSRSTKRTDSSVSKAADTSEPASLVSSAHSLPTVIVYDKIQPPTAKGPTRALSNRIKRGYSDGAKVGSYVNKNKSRARHLSGGTGPRQQRDDSLDYCLDPSDLRRMQMSPTLRHSVEFIRNNSIESARVVRVFKNGEPFEKPLRVCVTRGEFNSLEHLLDHINTRQLIAFGARYLFHMDGQLVYSVHELKHQKSYVVSGVRQFDYRAASIVKDRLRREQEQAEAWQNSHPMHRHLHRRDKSADGSARSSQLQLDADADQEVRVEPRGPIAQSTALAAGASASTLEHELADDSQSRFRSRAARKKQPAVTRTGARLRNGQTTRTSNAVGAGTGKVPHEAHLRHKLIAPTSRSAAPSELTAVQKQQTRDVGNFDSMEVFYDEENAEIDLDEVELQNGTPAKQPIITRAKSEMSGLPTKRKKNVTFIDTGRGSSPALNGNQEPSRLDRLGDRADDDGVSSLKQSTMKPSIKALSTGEIGIQVSDSLEGHLIDLPIPLPETGTHKKISARGRRPVGRGGGYRRTRGQRGAGGKIVAFSERQLSLDEMSQLTDLDRGDHHSVEAPPEVRIERNSIGSMDDVSASAGERDDDKSSRTHGSEGDAKESASTGSEGSKVSKKSGAAENSAGSGDTQAAKSDWQYPGGREQTATPIERPVSQSEPNESVRARVTTPTPSLSTGGDNNSLTLSYDTSVAINMSDAKPDVSPSAPKRRPPSTAQRKLPPKKIVPVQGAPCNGVDPPERNFRLVWVNGFTINDQYPSNSLLSAPPPRTDTASSPPASRSPTHGPIKLLGPNQTAQVKRLSTIDFKPSERFHNWICHSRLHDELIYPAGALIVLWSRWSDAQRYYSKHTSNVTCISLASLDLDLAASAQIADSTGRVQPAIHLWSLTDLTTLLVIGEDLFRARRVISLRLRHSASSGCDISVAARDDKCLWLYAIHLDSNEVRPKKTDANTSDGREPLAATEERKSRVTMSVAKINKTLQAGQLPLLLTNLSEDTYSMSVVNETTARPTNKEKSKQKEVITNQRSSKTDELLISFGRKHFQVWSIDRRQSSLKALQSDKKESRFAEMIAKSNCLARLSPSEFLLGDSNGNIALLKINLSSQYTDSSAKSLIGGLTRSSTATTGRLQKYSIETVNLVGPRTGDSDQQQVNSRDPHVPEKEPDKEPVAVTCLARVSGNLFASGDSNCTMRFWRLLRTKDAITNQLTTVSCSQVSCISLPADLGLVCTILSAKYDRKQATVEFYVVSTSNAILFGHVKLSSMQSGDKSANSADMLANSSLSVVYEGHETSVTGLVADVHNDTERSERASRMVSDTSATDAIYFTCSLDCKVCKWSKNKLVWKSMLPSACASIAVHPIGSVLAVGSVDGTVYIIDKLSGLLVSYFPLTPVRINCLGYAFDGSLLAAGCLNGSIFMLPVYDRGLKYKKVSIFQSPYPVVSLQFSTDNRHILTSVTHGSYQELILWDLPNFRYMRDNVKLAADKIDWFDSICSGSEDVRATWENANIESSGQADSTDTGSSTANTRKFMRSSSSNQKISTQSAAKTPAIVINLSCHRLIVAKQANKSSQSGQPGGHTSNFAIASDTHGYLRLFRHPCYNIDQGFYAIRTTSDPMNCCRFLARPTTQTGADRTGAGKEQELYFVTTSLDGSICIWSLDRVP